MKKLIPTIALAAVGAVAATGSTFAWFSMNKTVTAEGMHVKATTAGALIIGSAPESVNGLSVNFEETSAHELSHSTHDSAADFVETGLKTIVDDSTTVNPLLGTATDASYVVAKNTTGVVNYYFDYTVYIASAGEVLEDNKLTMSFTDLMKKTIAQNWALNNGTRTKETLFGFTADVYALEYSGVTDAASITDEPEYVGTIHFDNPNNSLVLFAKTDIENANDAAGTHAGIKVRIRVYLDAEYDAKEAEFVAATGTAKAGVQYFTQSSGKYLPVELNVGTDLTTGSYYELGALTAVTDGSKYVKNEKADTSDLEIGFQFTAEKVVA